jgi:hypothetical protein
MVSGNPEDDLDTCRRLETGGNSRVNGSRKQKEPVGGMKERWIEGHNTFRGSMPNFFMREISVVRFMSIRAAAPSGPATRRL